MADNITVTEAAAVPEPPALSVSNWPGEQPETPAEGDTAGDAPPPAPEGDAPAAETPAAEGGAGEAGEGGAAPPDGEIPADGTVAAPAKPDRSLSGRLSKATRERNEERARADQLAGLLEKTLDRLGPEKPAAAGATETPPAAVTDPRPKREAFDDPEAYDEALIQWSTRASTRIAQSEFERSETERRQREQTQERDRQMQQRHATNVERWNQQQADLANDPSYADFEDVAYNPDLQIPAPLAGMIVGLEANAKVMYHLGKHPDQAAELAKLTTPNAPTFDPERALRMLGAIEYQIANVRPQVSKAPDPIRPIGNVNRALAKTNDEKSMEEYAADRVPQLQSERRGSMFGNRTH